MKHAFTLIELTFVIVIIGILSAVILPRFNSQNNADTAIKLLSHIRYTQHLAMVDDKFKTSSMWKNEMWKIDFNQTNSSYSIKSGTTFAKDALDKKELKDISIKSTFSFSGGCAAKNEITFDNLGRPYLNNLVLLHTPCIISLVSSGEKNETITIFQETGYAKRN